MYKEGIIKVYFEKGGQFLLSQTKEMGGFLK